jgi:pseudouridine-5'-monophosphatase
MTKVMQWLLGLLMWWQVLIDELQLEGHLTPQDFLQQREEVLDKLFPTSALMPGAERLIRYVKVM